MIEVMLSYQTIREFSMNELYEKNKSSKEDYLELIYEMSLENKNFKAVDIAKKMNISRASVSEALKKLSEQGYIIYTPDKQTQLTEKGVEIAKKVLHKHNILFEFFTNYLGLSDDEATVNACRIEHIITDSAFSKIKEMIEKK